MADKLRKANPQAFSNVLRRMLEAAGEGGGGNCAGSGGQRSTECVMEDRRALSA